MGSHVPETHRTAGGIKVSSSKAMAAGTINTAHTLCANSDAKAESWKCVFKYPLLLAGLQNTLITFICWFIYILRVCMSAVTSVERSEENLWMPVLLGFQPRLSSLTANVFMHWATSLAQTGPRNIMLQRGRRLTTEPQLADTRGKNIQWIELMNVALFAII